MKSESNIFTVSHLLVAVCLLVYWCHCQSDSDSIESNESEKVRKIDMIELGKNITDTILYPCGTPDALIENIHIYYKALVIIHNDMKNAVKEAIYAFRELKNQGGPPFLKLCPIDDKPLEKFYNWRRYHGIEFRGFIKYNEDEWYEMNEYANKSALAIY